MTNYIETKKVIIYNDKIVFKRRNLTINKKDIEKIFYAKWSIKNYFMLAKYMSPGYVYIILKNKTFWRKWYCFKMRFEEAIAIPKSLCDKIEIVE